MATLDCVVIGYHSGAFDDYRAMCERAGEDSPEMQIYRKEHMVLDGIPMSWMDAFSRLRADRGAYGGRYHVGEV